MDADFCIAALNETLSSSQCEIFNTNQGSQFTTNRFTGPLLEKGIRVSMDSRGRALDNIFVERLWRSVKYEKVYLNDFQTVNEAYLGLKDYFEFYNHRRIHQSLDYRTPAEVYYKKTVYNWESLQADSMWTKREFPTERVDKLMENDKSVSHELTHTNSPFDHIPPQ